MNAASFAFGTGHKPDPEIVRQRRSKFHMLSAQRGLGAVPWPLSTNNRQFLQVSAGGPGILNQGPTSACEGHAPASGITLSCAIRKKPVPLISPIGLYTMARVLARTPNADGTLPPLTDDGTEPSLVLQAAQQWSILSAASWGNYPANPMTINSEPTFAELESSGTSAFGGGYFLTSSGDQFCKDVMTAMAAGYVLTGAIAASGATFQNYRGGILPALDDQVDHATLWIDYEWDGTNLSSLVVYGANSWGGEPGGWGESDAPGITGGMYRGNRDFLCAYNQDCAVLDVTVNGSVS